MKKKTVITPSLLSNIFIAAIILIALLWLITKLLGDGLYPLASILSAVAVFLGMVYLRPRFTPYRWLAIGMALSILFTVYPILYTVVISMTNMGSGHLMTKQQAVARLEQQVYYPENGASYKWAAFEKTSAKGEYALWLMPDDGSAGQLATPGGEIQTVTPGEKGVGQLDENGVPLTIDGYKRLERKAAVPILQKLSEIDFGLAPNTVRIRSLGQAVAAAPLYRYDAANDTIISQQTGETYKPVEGTYTSEAGEKLAPGYTVNIGLRHFSYFLGNDGFRKPLGKLLLWNLAFTFFSVFFSFVVGLIATLMFDDLPGKQIIRAILIIPWPIPVLVSVLIWRSMLNPDLGFIAPILTSMFGSSPAWFQDANAARFALVMINVWLSYPYFYVITAGALRAIPEEINWAAIVDGADAWQRFTYITLPLLMRILTPLLVASLTFNFNNFNVIFIFNAGNPAMPNTSVPMGYTDILISFVYRLAFNSSIVTDYGLAASMTIILFLLISVAVILQIRYANMFKEVD
jgi:ABC-type sugar transport system permease subunit